MKHIILLSASFLLGCIECLACGYHPDGPVIFWRDPLSFLKESIPYQDCSYKILEELKCVEFENRYPAYAFGNYPRVAHEDTKREDYKAYRKELLECTDRYYAQRDARLGFEYFLAILPKDMEEELIIYETGAIHYRLGEYAQAEFCFKYLLELPENARKYKSIEAAYMLGRIYHNREKYQQAREAYAMVFELYRDGFMSSEGLNIDALGFDAYTYLQEKNYLEAFYRYLSAYVAIDMDKGIRETIREAVEEGYLEEFAADKTASYFVCAFADSMSPGHPKIDELWNRWLDAMEKEGRNAWKFGGRMAMNAYRRGNFALARRCVKLADPNEPLARYVSAKLLLMNGKTEESAEIISDLIKNYSKYSELWEPMKAEERNRFDYGLDSVSIPSNPHYEVLLKSNFSSMRSRILAEYGILYFTKNDLDGALDSFLAAERYIDAAFICEIAMSIENLKEYADARLDDFSKEADFVRAALALRLLHIGDIAGMRKYYAANPGRAEYARLMDLFCDALQKGRDAKLARRERAIKIWEAFTIYTELGFSFFGEVHRPLVYDEDADDFGLGIGLNKAYFLIGFSFRWKEYGEHLMELKNPANDLINRRKREFKAQDNYYYKCFNFGFEAAELLEENSQTRAEMYVLAARYVKVRNPKLADKAYKALVRKCGKSELGQLADKRRWFPGAQSTAREILNRLTGLNTPPLCQEDDV